MESLDNFYRTGTSMKFSLFILTLEIVREITGVTRIKKIKYYKL